MRARFGPGRGLVLSGSDDGSICIWEMSTGALAQRLRAHLPCTFPVPSLHLPCTFPAGALAQRLRAHTDVAYDASWSEAEGMLASCSHDGTVRTWCHSSVPEASCEPIDLPDDPWALL